MSTLKRARTTYGSKSRGSHPRSSPKKPRWTTEVSEEWESLATSETEEEEEEEDTAEEETDERESSSGSIGISGGALLPGLRPRGRGVASTALPMSPPSSQASSSALSTPSSPSQNHRRLRSHRSTPTAGTPVEREDVVRKRDIRSFFTSHTAPVASSKPTRATGRLGATVSQPTITTHQLLLDLSNRPTTQTCPQCSMSFVLGVPEDVALHEAHHKKVVGGIEWFEDDGREVWAHGKDKVVVVELGEGKRPRKIREILEMVDVALSAQPLEEKQLEQAKLFMLVGPPASKQGGGKGNARVKGMVVKAVCVATRISHAYRVVSPTKATVTNSTTTTTLPTSPTPLPSSHDAFSSSPPPPSSPSPLLRFGEDTSAVFCSPTPHPALLGIHRIYTLPTYRGQGLAYTLLNQVADKFVYGLSLLTGNSGGKTKVAFSQPTESGRRLAVKWAGEGFAVFVE